jgi:hypothetical protein
VAGEELHRLGSEDVGVVLDRPLQPAGALDEHQRDVHLGHAQLRVGTLDLEPAETAHGAARGNSADQVEHGLEQRRVAEIANGLKALDDLVEGHVLVRVGLQRALTHAPDQLAEGLHPDEVGPHDQGVHEEADEPFQLLPVAAGDRNAHADLALPRPARQDRLEGGEQHHEQGGPFGLRHQAQPLEHRGGHGEDVLAPAAPLHGRTRMVRGEVERLGPGEPLLPVGELARHFVSGQPLALP